MTEENITQKFRLKCIDETRNYFVEEWWVGSTKKFV